MRYFQSRDFDVETVHLDTFGTFSLDFTKPSCLHEDMSKVDMLHQLYS